MVGDAAGIERGEYLLEVFGGGFVEVVGDLRESVDEVLILGSLGVEDAKGVGFGAAAIVFAQLVFDGRKGLAQGGYVARAVGCGADGVDLEAPAFDAEFVEQGGEHLEDLGVADGAFGAARGGSDDLCADLPELAIPSALRALAAELRADVEELLQVAGVAELVLDVGADDAGGVFGAKGEGLCLLALGAGAVFPGVHFFRDDVGLFADAAGEEFGGFDEGGADFAESIAREEGARDRFDAVPKLGLGRQEVAGPTNCLQR